MEEDEETLYKFGWVNAGLFLEDLKNVQKHITGKAGFHSNLKLNDNRRWYFDKDSEEVFLMMWRI